MFLVVLALGVSADLNSYAGGFSYDFVGKVNVSSFSDVMKDKNANGVNDTLNINITTNVSSGSYFDSHVWTNEYGKQRTNFSCV